MSIVFFEIVRKRFPILLLLLLLRTMVLVTKKVFMSYLHAGLHGVGVVGVVRVNYINNNQKTGKACLGPEDGGNSRVGTRTFADS